MPERIFESSLTMEQIGKNLAEPDFFSGLVEALEEAVNYGNNNQTVALKE
jgi:hypothetical protein